MNKATTETIICVEIARAIETGGCFVTQDVINKVEKQNKDVLLSKIKECIKAYEAEGYEFCIVD